MRPWFLRIVAALVALGVAIVTIRAIGSGTIVRRFNKHILNPFALWVAGRRPMYYGVIHHVGRRSGRAYSTPVVAKLTTDGIIIPLPYGSDTDWCRNVLAAGRAELTLQGTEYAVEHPLIVDEATAAPLVPAATARVWHQMGIDKYLRLEPRQAAASELTTAA